MNRREFLATVAAGLAAAADPERLLWVPGKKKIFIPRPVELGPADPDYHWPSDGVQLMLEMTLEEFKRRYPASAARIAANRRTLYGQRSVAR
jgi:hypothetical protein